MNILIVSPLFPPYSGVGGVRMNSLSKYLQQNGHNVFVIRNTPSLCGEGSLNSKVPKYIEITDVNACLSRKKNAQLYYDAIKELSNEQKIDLIIFSVGPYYTLRIAPRVRKILGIKYVIDFRDLLVYDRREKRTFYEDLKRFIYRYMHWFVERAAVNSSEAVVVVTPGDNKTMSRHYKKKRNRVYTIYNGYENVELVNCKTRSESDFTIASFGKLGYYSIDLVELLFSAVTNMVQKDKNILINHIGQKEASIEELLLSGRFIDVKYDCTGLVSYEEGRSLLKQADVCLIIYNHPTGLGTKVFDYIACNKPIILLTRHGKALAQLISSFKNGFVCESAKCLESTISKILEDEIKTLDDEKDLAQYSRHYQNEQYMKIIESQFGSKE